MRHFNFIALLAASTMALSACGSGQPENLGTRDDIVVTNRGMPLPPTPPTPDVTTPITAPAAASSAAVAVQADKVEEVVVDNVKAAANAVEGVAKVPEVAVPEEQKLVEKSVEIAAIKAPEPVTVPAPMKEMPAKRGATAKAAAETAVTESAIVPTPVTRTTTSTTTISTDLNCDPNKVPMNAVAGGCYARVIIPNKGSNCMELRQIMCKDNMSTENVKRIQTKLNPLGYVVPIDGVFGPVTVKAMDAYQRKNGLATGALTYESLNHLGVMVEGAKN